MKKSIYFVLSALVLLSMILGACAPAAATVTEEAAAPAEPTKAPEPTKEPEPTEAPEPTAEPESAMASEEDLDASFSAMLASMKAYNTIKPDALLVELAEDTPPFLLDVRTTEEVEENGHIPGATHIPLNEIAQNINLLPDLDTPIVTYCAGGWRATIAMTALHGMGFNDVRALKVAFSDWVAAGNPVEPGLPENMELGVAEPDPGLVAAMDAVLSAYGVKPYGGVNAEGLNTAIAEGGLIVIDARTAGEVEEQGYIDTGAEAPVFLPLEEWIAGKDMWPADKDAKIAVYCGSGHRSTMALTMLWAYGYSDVWSLQGGFGGWKAGEYPVMGGAAPEASILDVNFQTMIDNMQAYNTVNAETLLVEMAEDTPPFLLDVRTTEEVETNGHIPGATHIPLADLAKHTNLLPALDTPIVTYCAGGWRATIAMTSLHGIGFTNVRALKVAFADWVDAGNPVEPGLPENMELDAVEIDADLLATFDASLAIYGNKPYGGIDAEAFNASLAENPDLVVIDARTAGEVAEKGVVDTGDIPLLTIPLESFIASMDQWPAGKDTPIVVYCGSGHRSTMALAILGAYGYTDVLSLKGGFGGWAAGGFPTMMMAGDALATIDANLQTMLNTMEGYNTVKADALMVELAEDQPPFLLDVRTTEEVEANGHIPGATHIPLNELAQNTNLLPDFDTPIVTYCAGGWRATIAMTALHAMGWNDVRALKVAFQDWVDAGNPVAEGLPENMLLDVAQPGAEVIATVEAALSAFGVKPYGGINAEGLNAALVENPDLIVIDARTEAELAEKGVVDAGDVAFIAIPLESYLANMDQWPADKDAAIVVYCGSGHRSTMAMTIMWIYGYTNVSSLQGGFSAWAEAGFPVAEFVPAG